MLSMQDILDYCDLNDDVIEVIADHTGVPMIVAAEISEGLLCSPEGVCRLHMMLVECMKKALEQEKNERVLELMEIYEHLKRSHPLPTHF
ncbi:hypothetical protein [Azonexus sp.]|uniref:hypothetical protein n=1 Tax=Azonexus sp. TaxID=1872668 RepID=UPI0039E70FBF